MFISFIILVETYRFPMYIHYFLDDNRSLAIKQLPDSLEGPEEGPHEPGYLQKLVEAIEESGLEISLLFRCCGQAGEDPALAPV